MSSGWIKLHRSMLEWEWWGDERMVKMFVYLLLSCNTEPGNFHGETVLPGEVIVGRKMLSERLHMPERVVRSTLDKLTSTGEIVRWTNNHFTKISIRNWDKYQMVSLSDQTPTERQPFVQPEFDVLNSKTAADEKKTANRLSDQTPTECHKQEERIIEESISCRDTKEATAASATPRMAAKNSRKASGKNELPDKYGLRQDDLPARQRRDADLQAHPKAPLDADHREQAPESRSEIHHLRDVAGVLESLLRTLRNRVY